MTWLDALAEKSLVRELPTRAEALNVLKTTDRARGPGPRRPSRALENLLAERGWHPRPGPAFPGCALSRHVAYVLGVITGSRYVCDYGDPCP